MSNLKISFNPEFFCAETKRTDEQVISNNDIVCKHLSDVYTQSIETLNQPKFFSKADEDEISRGNSYAFIGGGSIKNTRKSLRRKGLIDFQEQNEVLTLLLQSKLGLQFAIGAQMIGTVLMLGNGEARMAPTEEIKTIVQYDRRTRTTTIKFQADIFSFNLNSNQDGRDIGVKIGLGEASVSFNHSTKELKLHKLDMTIYSGRPEQKIFKTQAACFSSDRKSQARRDADKIKTPSKDILRANSGFFAWIKSLFTRTETIFIKPAEINHEAIKQRQVEAFQKKFPMQDDSPFRVLARILTEDELDKLKQAKQQKPTQRVIENKVEPEVTQPASPVEQDNTIEKPGIMQLFEEQEERFKAAMVAHREMMQRHAEQIARTERCIVEAAKLLNEFEQHYPTSPIVCP